MKPGKDRGLEDPVWDRVTGRLLGAARWIGTEGGRGGGLGGAEEIWTGVAGRWGSEGEAGVGSGSSGQELVIIGAEGGDCGVVDWDGEGG